MICEGKIAVTKKLAQRFQRDDFCLRRNARTLGACTVSIENRSATILATIPVCGRPGPLPPNLPALAP
jgi:hypothetical protein